MDQFMHSRVLARLFLGWCSTTWIVWYTTWMTMESNYAPLGRSTALGVLALK